MPNTLQAFLAVATKNAADELTEALRRIPEDKRAWCPQGKARTAIDVVAECAILNGYTIDMIRTRQWSEENAGKYVREKDEAVALGPETVIALLHANTERVIAVIREVPDDVLGEGIAMPWGTQTMAEIVSYPFWNMTYHTGQVNYVASMLGCLD